MSGEGKAQLHQLLPVESNLQGLVNNIINEAVSTFAKKERFTGTVNKLMLFDDNRKNEELTEVSDITTTVDDKLEYVSEHLVRYYDAFLQKEATNQEAYADLIVDGKTLAVGVPATALLGMETKLKAVRNLINDVPTLQPGIKWVATDVPGVYQAESPEERLKTEKTVLFKEVSKATDKHPAQVEKWTSDVPVGKYTKTVQSSMWTSAKKSMVLGKVDKLIQSVMEARMRANSTPVENVKFGQAIMDYILK